MLQYVVFNILVLAVCVKGCSLVILCRPLCLMLEHLCFRSRLSSSIVFHMYSVYVLLLLCVESGECTEGRILSSVLEAKCRKGGEGSTALHFAKTKITSDSASKKSSWWCGEGTFFWRERRCSPHSKKKKKVVRKQQQIPWHMPTFSHHHPAAVCCVNYMAKVSSEESQICANKFFSTLHYRKSNYCKQELDGRIRLHTVS